MVRNQRNLFLKNYLEIISYYFLDNFLYIFYFLEEKIIHKLIELDGIKNLGVKRDSQKILCR